MYWRCTQYTTWFRCHGRLHTDAGRIVHSSSHNHGRAESGEKPSMRKLKTMKLIANKECMPSLLPPMTLTAEQ